MFIPIYIHHRDVHESKNKNSIFAAALGVPIQL